MRVAGGAARGFKLRSLRRTAVRPTTDLVRNAIFSILGPWVEESEAIDLYAGTGTLGIEALSRGARHVDFVEVNARQCAVIKANLLATGFSHRARVIHRRVEKALASLEGPYDLVLLDPPYTQPFPAPVLERLGVGSRLLRSDCQVVVGHSRRVSPGEQYGRLHLAQDRRYGDTSVAFYEVAEVA